MIEIKRIEIRDRATLVPAFAILVDPRDENEKIARHAGFREIPYVFLLHLTSMRVAWDPYAWGMSRTMHEAHKWLQLHWDEIADNGVLDVEYILGERTQPKTAECV
jgi:hypothetical protein